MSGNPIDSPRCNCCLDTVWKFDQIAGSPITRVCTSGAVCTIACRSFVAASMDPDAAPR